jgi:hypothetical protein
VSASAASIDRGVLGTDACHHPLGLAASRTTNFLERKSIPVPEGHASRAVCRRDKNCPVTVVLEIQLALRRTPLSSPAGLSHWACALPAALVHSHYHRSILADTTSGRVPACTAATRESELTKHTSYLQRTGRRTDPVEDDKGQLKHECRATQLCRQGHWGCIIYSAESGTTALAKSEAVVARPAQRPCLAPCCRSKVSIVNDEGFGRIVMATHSFAHFAPAGGGRSPPVGPRTG